MVWGANTDVGKTVVASGLVQAALRLSSSPLVHYIKPLQTGMCPTEPCRATPP